MNASHILDAMGTIDDKYIMEAKERSFMNTTKKARNMKRTLALAAVVAALLTPLRICRLPAGLVRPVAAKAVCRPGADRPKRLKVRPEGIYGQRAR